MKIKEIRTIEYEKVRLMCIRHNLYDCGSNKDYQKLCDLCYELKNVSSDDLRVIAEDILNHSDIRRDITDIMFLLANFCCYVIFEEE